MWAHGIDLDLGEVLGEGSQGRVFKALRRDRRTRLAQTVAVKVLHSETAVELWKQEFESLARVRSPYCVTVFAFERIKSRPALILEYVDGVSLAKLGATGALNESDIQEVLAQAEAALKDLNSYGLCHGDLSPQNILIDRDGCLRLLDFGLANAPGTELRVTPEFAAPERLAGAPLNLAADLFSLGRIECYLRGLDLDRVADVGYLSLRPSRRKLQASTPDPLRRQQLAQKVRAFQKRQSQVARLRTRTQNLLRAAPARMAALPFLIWLLTSLPVSSATHQHRPPLARLDVHTRAWHRLVLDGVPVGFAPVQLTIQAGHEHRLEWTSARGRGRIRVILAPGERRRLKDSDFLH